MSGTLDFITILLLVLAVVIFLRLRNVLGRRTGHERPPFDYGSQKENNEKESAYGQDNVVTLPRTQEQEPVRPTPENTEKDIAKRVKEHAEAGSVLEQSLKDVIERDATFDPTEFLTGAKTAYEMIVVAYSEGNKQLLQPLLSSDVYEGFEEEIDNREDRGEVMDSSFVGIDKAHIIEAELKGREALITVKFVSEMIIAVRNKDGKILSGDPKKIIDVTDIWTFSRDVTSKDPNWKLIGTGSVN